MNVPYKPDCTRLKRLDEKTKLSLPWPAFVAVFHFLSIKLSGGTLLSYPRFRPRVLPQRQLERTERTNERTTKKFKSQFDFNNSPVVKRPLKVLLKFFKMQLSLVHSIFFTLFFRCVVLQDSFPPKKFKCFSRSIYMRNCKVYNYQAPLCFKWDVSQCPNPDVRHQETHCTVYTCQEITYSNKSSKKVDMFKN